MVSLSEKGKDGVCERCGGQLSPDEVCPTCLLGLASGDASDAVADSLGTQLGDYELIAEIGRGGMGVVYKARQLTLNRLVVVKMIHGGVFADRKQIERFQYEARAASRLVHPSIVPIYEIGEFEGQHFFTMALYEEGTLADQMERFQLPLERSSNSSSRAVSEERQDAIAELMATVARAVHHAHQHGVIHRDLKPSNILLDPHGAPHVGDFSLAKVSEEESGLTVTGAVLGTPGFMSPEQASGRVREVGVASDVYGLGAILYQLLTGKPPFEGENSTEILRRVQEEEPALPRRLRPQVHADLETICHHCLEKNPHQRYRSALEVAEELERYRRREPIQARPIKPVQRLVRWCQRKPALASMLAVLGVVGLTGITGVTLQRNAAVEANVRLSTTLQMMDSQLVDSLVMEGRAMEGLEHLLDRLRENSGDEMALQRALSLLEHNTLPLPSQAPVKVGPWARMAVFDPSEERLAIVAGHEGSEETLPRLDPRLFEAPGLPEVVRLWDRASGSLIEAEGRHEGRIQDLVFQPDWGLLATGSWDGTAKIWNARDLRLICNFRHEAPLWAVRFSPDQKHFITLSGDAKGLDKLSVWETTSWRQIQQTSFQIGDRRYARFSPNGKLLAIAGSVWALNEKGEYVVAKELMDLHRRKGSEVAFGIGEFTRDNRYLLTFSKDRFAQVFDVLTGISSVRTKKHFGDLIHGEISPSGHLFVTGSNDRSAQIWMTDTGEAASPALRHDDAIYEARFSPYGNLVATASADGTVGVWDAFSGEKVTRIRAGSRPVMGIQFYEGGHHLAAISSDGWVSFWDIRDGVAWPERGEDGPQIEESTSAFPIGKGIAFIRRTLDQGNWRGGTVWESDSLHYLGNSIEGWSEDVLDRSRKSETLHARPIHSIQKDVAEEKLATASEDGTARVWHLETMAPITPPLSHGGPVYRARFSHDGTRLVTGSEDGMARIWHATEGTLLTSVNHESAVVDARFSDDDRWVIVGSRDGYARIWESDTGQPVTPPLRHGAAVVMARILPDQERLAVGTEDARLRIWDIKRAVPLTEPMPMPVFPARLFYSAKNDGVQIAGRTRDRQNTGSVFSRERRYQLSLAQPPSNPPAWFMEVMVDVWQSQSLSHGRSLPRIWEKLWSRIQRDDWSSDFYGRWCRWFFADRSRRSVNPSSEVSIAQKSSVIQLTPELFQPEFTDPIGLAGHLSNLSADRADLFVERVRRLESAPEMARVAYLLSKHATYLSPDLDLAWLETANYALELDQFDEGLRAAEKAITSNPSNVAAQEAWNEALFETRNEMLEEIERKAVRADEDLEEMARLIQAEADRMHSNVLPKQDLESDWQSIEIFHGEDAVILGLDDKTILVPPRVREGFVALRPSGVRIPSGADRSLYLDGLDDYLRIGYLPLEDGPFTIEAWVRTSRISPQILLNCREQSFDPLTDDPWFGMSIESGVPTLWLCRGDEESWQSVPSMSPLDENWNHIAVVRDGERILWYVNGNLEVDQGGIATRDVTLNEVVIGGWPARDEHSSTGLYFEGSLDEFRVWTVARTSEEIQSNMKRPLSGDEPGLIRYYRFNETVLSDKNEKGQVLVRDHSTQQVHGIAFNTVDDVNHNLPGVSMSGGQDLKFGAWPDFEGYQLVNDRTGTVALQDTFPVGVTPVTWTLSQGDKILAQETVNIVVRSSDESPDAAPALLEQRP